MCGMVCGVIKCQTRIQILEADVSIARVELAAEIKRRARIEDKYRSALKVMGLIDQMDAAERGLQNQKPLPVWRDGPKT